jgi:hypothetical protein
MIRASFVLAFASTLVACSDDPVSYSAPVAINLKAKSADTTGGVVSDDKGITTESGNPYGAFVSAAMDELGGREPSTIGVDSAEVFLGANSVGVTSLGEIFVGPMEVLFEMNDTANSYPVGTATIVAATGAGPVPIDLTFEGVSAVDHAKLLGGSFKVIVRGPSAPEFETKGADADLQVTFTFAAFE